MKIFKKICTVLFDKDSWISTLIETLCTAIFIFVGGYIAFVTAIQPVWFKLTLVALSAIFSYLLCGVIQRYVFKKLGRKSPLA